MIVSNPSSLKMIMIVKYDTHKYSLEDFFPPGDYPEVS